MKSAFLVYISLTISKYVLAKGQSQAVAWKSLEVIDSLMIEGKRLTNKNAPWAAIGQNNGAKTYVMLTSSRPQSGQSWD